MIVDAHLHVWKPAPDFPDPGATTVSPQCDVPLELFAQYMDEYGVNRGVLVQPLYPGEDNSYVADAAAGQPDRYKAVCVVDPRKPDAADRLEYWAGERGCKGLRLRPEVPEEGEVFGRPSTFELWKAAGRLGVVVNLLTGFTHLPAVAAMARRFPHVRVIIDHMAHPPVGAGPRTAVYRPLLSLADLPNVRVKVSGAYYCSRQPYPHQDCAELLRVLYDQFGPGRLIWGSDFPHVLLKSGYLRSLKWLERLAPFLSGEEVWAIMGGNASRLYWK